jgi:hypothetical protein
MSARTTAGPHAFVVGRVLRQVHEAAFFLGTECASSAHVERFDGRIRSFLHRDTAMQEIFDFFGAVPHSRFDWLANFEWRCRKSSVKFSTGLF